MSSAVEILRVFRYRPRLAAELLRESLGFAPPSFDGVRVEGLDGGAVSDRGPLVVVLTSGREPVLAIVVDALGDCDSSSRVRWPQWAEVASARIGCTAIVLIVTADVVVERWAKQPVHLPPGPPFEPFVLGPSAVPGHGGESTPILVLMTLAARITRDA
jgi:hypothetical protein